MKLLRKLMGDGRGATAIEYALIASLIAIAAIAAFRTLGTNIDNTFNEVKDKVDAAPGQSG